jgi:hypothetical protein
MGFDIKQLKEASKSLYNFGGRRIESIGSISLPVPFGSRRNAHIEYITFDVVEMNYPYNTIFGRDLLNIFEATLHSLYPCLKVLVALGMISIHGNQKDARNIEQGFASGHKNVNCMQDEKAENSSGGVKSKNEGSFISKPIELECETKRVPLDPRVPDKAVMISQDLLAREEAELLSFLDKNYYVFMWQTSNLIGLGRDIIEHKL